MNFETSEQLEMADLVNNLRLKIKALEDLNGLNPVTVRSKAVKMLMKEAAMGMGVDEVISRADKIADFILNGQRPVLTPRALGE